MNKFARFLIVFVVAVASFYFSYWILGAVLFLPFYASAAGDESYRIVWAINFLCSALCAVFAARYVWRKLKSAPPGLSAYVFVGAFITGAVGFCAGFFGPMIFSPQSNQGPMLGIFITGPLGFILGAIGGFIYGMVKSKKEPSIGMDADPGVS